jgi:hypothetical protein
MALRWGAVIGLFAAEKHQTIARCGMTVHNASRAKFFRFRETNAPDLGLKSLIVPAGSYDHLTAASSLGCFCERKPVQATERDDETPDVFPRIDPRFVVSAA